MADKRRSADLPSLPLKLVNEPKHNDLVKQHWNVTFARQGKMGVVAKRIMARVLDQIRDDDFQLREFYQLSVADVTDCVGINRDNAYGEVEAALRELVAATWEFKDVEGESWQIRHLLDTTKKTAVGYEQGVIRVLLNPQLAPFFIQIAHYTTYRLDGYMRLRSWYSMRLYEILSAFRDTGYWEVGLDEYRQLFDCWYQTDKRGRVLKDKQGSPRLKYPNVHDLVNYTTAEALAELAGTDMAFRYEPRYETGRVGPGRRRIVGLRFELLRPVSVTIPLAWLSNPVTGPVIEKLRSWKVADRNIAQYATVLQREGISRLIREWELKENSTRRIDSREKYCNTAFVRAAKLLLDEQKQEALRVREELQLGLFGAERPTLGE